MPYQFPPDIDEQVKIQVASGLYKTEDEVLRDAMKALHERNEDLASIQAGVADMEAGRFTLLGDVEAELRKNYDIPHDA